MSKITLQVPVDKALKISAEKVALEEGFSSLQEAIRVFMKQLSKKALTLRFSNDTAEEIILSKAAEKRYSQTKDDIKNDKNIHKPKDDEEFFKLLRS